MKTSEYETEEQKIIKVPAYTLILKGKTYMKKIWLKNICVYNKLTFEVEILCKKVFCSNFVNLPTFPLLMAFPSK